jgi:translation initiation factor IF-2
MSKVRINDLARELEVKSRQILDVLNELGMGDGKTHSSSIEESEASRVRAHFDPGGKPSSAAASSAASRGKQVIAPKIDLSNVSKPGDVMKAVLAKREAESRGSAAPPPVVRVAAPTVVKKAPPVVAVVAPPARPIQAAEPAATVVVAKPAATAPAPPAPRKIVPQPRQAPNIIPQTPAAPATPAIASKPPVAAVVSKPAAPAAPTVAVVVKPPVAPPAPPVEAPVKVVVEVAEPEKPVQEEISEVVAEAQSSTAPRRVVMPQTGPRPVYKAHPTAPVTNFPASTGSFAPGNTPQRGRPIFDRNARPSGPGGQGGQGGPGGSSGYVPRQGAPGQFAPGGPRPKHPTRPGAPTGPGGRPGFGAPRPGGGFGARPGGFAPGGAPPPTETPRPQRAPQKGRGGSRTQYPKTKEGPMKGFVPPPRFGGAHYNSNEPVPITREITVTEGISVKDLAEKLEIRAKDLIASLLMGGVMVTVNQSLDAEMVKELSAKFGAGATVISYEEEIANESLEEILESNNIDEHEVPRAPVVTVMGHVDHGKTSLLDAIRETDVAAGEAGGITQHIGAYKVCFSKEGSPASGREIVFLDTPGHEAFTRMRARGAKVTDIVVIVVAADDGVMPQTIEAIDHAKAANVPIIVAVNKVDKPEANPDRVKKQLADRGLIPEEWAVGEQGTVFVEVSAKKRKNLDLLLEMICLVSDIRAPKATPGRKALGTVLEAKLDRGRGTVATVLVQDGTLNLNDSYIVGNTFGKVRAMFDDRGRALTTAGPSTPVEVLGLEAMPDSGDTFLVVADRDKAKGIAQYRKMKEREAQLAKSSRVSLEGLAEQIRTAGIKDLPIILKGDVTGSVEVLADSLVRMSTEKVRIKVIHTGVGAITESDILLASASNAVVIGFNVRPERKAAELAHQENVEIRQHSIIYELQDEIQKAMLGLLDPTYKENYLGRAEILNVFKIPKVGTIAGCRVLDGVIRRDSEIKVMRGDEQIHKGKIASLKRFKDDAREVTNGMECGIGLANFTDLKEGDIIEALTTERIASDLGTRVIDRPKPKVEVAEVVEGAEEGTTK